MPAGISWISCRAAIIGLVEVRYVVNGGETRIAETIGDDASVGMFRFELQEREVEANLDNFYQQCESTRTACYCRCSISLLSSLNHSIDFILLLCTVLQTTYDAPSTTPAPSVKVISKRKKRSGV